MSDNSTRQALKKAIIDKLNKGLVEIGLSYKNWMREQEGRPLLYEGDYEYPDMDIPKEEKIKILDKMDDEELIGSFDDLCCEDYR